MIYRTTIKGKFLLMVICILQALLNTYLLRRVMATNREIEMSGIVRNSTLEKYYENLRECRRSLEELKSSNTVVTRQLTSPH